MMTERDLDLLSAYLDGALSSEDRAALEARLETDAGLRDELEGLRATVGLLRGLPTLSAPRAFTLTPEQARRERGARVTGYIVHSAAFRALSAAAVALIVFGAAILTLSSNLATPTASQFAPASTLGVAAFPTNAVRIDAFASASPAPTQQPQPTMSPRVLPTLVDTLQDGVEPDSPLPQAAEGEAAGAILASPMTSLPQDEESAADAAPPAMLFAAPTADAFASQPQAETSNAQRAFEEQESATTGADTMDAAPVTPQAEGLPSMSATAVLPLPTLPPGAGLALPAEPAASPTLAPPTQTLPPTQTAQPTVTAFPTMTLMPTISVPASQPPSVSTPNLGVLLIAGGALLLALALGLALLRGRVRG